jgi:hypothetical protein
VSLCVFKAPLNGTVKNRKLLALRVERINSRTYNSTAELLQGTVAGVINNGETQQPVLQLRGVGSVNL